MASLDIPAASSSSSFVPPSSCQQWKYDVFLSFRGEDTRMSFTDHLYAALNQKGIIAFRDDQRLERGKEIAPELLKAIEESKFSVVVLSGNYASSTWCLDELVRIVECMDTKGQLIFPVFYKVDPSDVRKQRGSFEKAFAKHEENFGQNSEKVKTWRIALTRIANLSGWSSKNRHEAKLIQDIVEEIFTRLNDSLPSTANDLIGIDSQLEKLNFCLGTSSDDVRIVGIHGMGGIGKTTLARVIFDKISNQFEASSFLANVREVSERNSLVLLQHQLLCETLKEENIGIWDVYKGMTIIRNRLCRKRILVVLDDVDKPEQLEALVGKQCWYGSGSRIIITTRDLQLLDQQDVDAVYKMEELNPDEALELFSLKAFKSIHPEEGFVELSKEVVRYAHGLPLALEVLGSFLYGKTVDEWVSAVARMKEDSEKEIFDRLEISFHGLKPTEKKIFLDVACFFKGMDKNYVMKLLDGFDFYAAIGIRVLLDKSLITIVDNNRLWMHDLLQEMGQKIVLKESPDEPGKRSRLWVNKNVLHVLTKDSGTEAVEMMMASDLLDMTQVHLSSKAFSKMSRLRLLKMSNGELRQGLEYLSNELRFLEWRGYPLKSLPLSFKPEKLVELNLSWSCIKQLWSGTRTLDRLKFINLSYSQALIRIPDLTGAPNLEKLVLEGCKSLVEVHSSIWYHKGLIVLNMRNCGCLWRLPSSIEMQSLQVLNLSGCFKVKKFPEFKGNMEHLSELYLDGTGIEQLPLSIEHLTGLVILNLNNCKNLVSLPSSICNLNSLKNLTVSGCLKLAKLPEKLGNVECLEELDVSGTAIRQTPSSIVFLKNLKALSFRGCGGQPPILWSSLLSSLLHPRKSSDSMSLFLPPLSMSSLCSLTSLNLSNCDLLEGAVPSDLGCLSSLKILDLSDNKFVSLPSSISQLSNLEILNLESCKRLQSLPELPTNVKFVGADDCIELENFPNPVKLCTSTHSKFNLFNCHRLVGYFDSSNLAWTWLKTYLKGLPSASDGFDICLPGSEIPKWLSNQSMGSSVTIDLPPHWNNSNLMGFAMCAVFRLQNVATRTCLDNDTRPYYLRATNVALACFFTNEKGEYLIHNHSGAWFPNCGLVKKCTQIGSDHIWLLYRHSHHDRDTLNELEHLTLSFYRQYGSGWDLEIRKCALRLVYEQDVEELHRSFISNSLQEGLEIHSDDFDKAGREGSTIKQDIDDCVVHEPGDSRSSPEEPLAKRLRKL